MTGDLLRRFLLGQVTDEEHAEIQERCFLDEEWHHRMLAAENDLIDAYVRGELSPEEQSRFEQRCAATPNQRRRVEFARRLARADK